MTFLLKKAFILVLVTCFLVQPVSVNAQVASAQPQTQEELLAYLYSIVIKLQAQLIELQNKKIETNNTTLSTRTYPNPYNVVVSTFVPSGISRDAVYFTGEVDRGSSSFVDVWFQYGEGRNLNRTAGSGYITTNGRQAISFFKDDLDSDTTYRYRLVAEDDKGYRHYGQTVTFTTIAPAQPMTFRGSPEVETEGVSAVTANSAYLFGFGSMNNQASGYAYVIYGKDKGEIEEFEDYLSFTDVARDLPTVKWLIINSNFFGRNTFVGQVTDLSRATRYYYRACIGYHHDGDTSDPAVRCGEVESFTTLN